MRFEHLGAEPRIHPDAVIAPTAVISGDVTIGADCQVLHGAVITAEGGAISLGASVIVMENALIRATSACRSCVTAVPSPRRSATSSCDCIELIGLRSSWAASATYAR